MKVPELRKKLKQLEKEELIKIAAEFYKRIPKAKREAYNLDELVENPSKKPTQSAAKQEEPLAELERQIYTFAEDARAQLYFAPNRVIPKKQRPKWRFHVKRWYKALANQRRTDRNLRKQVDLLKVLYEVLGEACFYIYFSAYDPFEAAGIEQTEFYKTIITLLQEAEGKGFTVEEAIRILAYNPLNRYTLYSDLMYVLIDTLDLPDLKKRAIDRIQKMIHESEHEQNDPDKVDDARQIRKRINTLTNLGLRLYIRLAEYEDGLALYKKHFFDMNEEVKLYILIKILSKEGEAELIVSEIEGGIQKGLKPRNDLINFKDTIKQTGQIPATIK